MSQTGALTEWDFELILDRQITQEEANKIDNVPRLVAPLFAEGYISYTFGGARSTELWCTLMAPDLAQAVAQGAKAMRAVLGAQVVGVRWKNNRLPNGPCAKEEGHGLHVWCGSGGQWLLCRGSAE